MANENLTNNKIPFFSVCVPVYNVEKYLRECLDSVLNQTEQDFEIILIDDGSTDNSDFICDEYVAKFPDKIRAYHNKINEGQFIARFSAISHARGQYLLFLDSDDFFEKDAFCEIKKTIEETGADLVFFGYKTYLRGKYINECISDYEDNQVFDKQGKVELYKDIVSKDSLNAIWQKCVRKDLGVITDDVFNYVGLNQGEDRLLSLSILDNASKIVYLGKALYVYRFNEASTTKNNTLKNYKSIEIVDGFVASYAKKWNVDEDVISNKEANRVQLGFSCAFSLAKQVINKTKNIEELKQAITYIANDKVFTCALNKYGKDLSTFKKKVCACIVKGNARGIIRLVKAHRILTKIRQKLKG